MSFWVDLFSIDLYPISILLAGSPAAMSFHCWCRVSWWTWPCSWWSICAWRWSGLTPITASTPCEVSPIRRLKTCHPKDKHVNFQAMNCICPKWWRIRIRAPLYPQKRAEASWSEFVPGTISMVSQLIPGCSNGSGLNKSTCLRLLIDKERRVCILALISGSRF